MTPYAGLLFFYILALFLLPAIVLGLLGRGLSRYGLFFTAAMLTVVFYENGELHQLVAFALGQTSLAFLYQRAVTATLSAAGASTRRSKWLLSFFIVLSLLPLALAKVGEISAPMALFRMLGVSYMTFRAVEVLIGLHDGRVQYLTPFRYLSFLLFFPSVASGPIDRYQRFAGELGRALPRAQYLPLLRKGLWKLLWGAFSAIVLSGLIQRFWLAPLPESGLGATLLYQYGYTFYLFFNFAGSSSMAVGTAYLLGVELPENFRAPFLSVDMKDFWSRWHISLSAWLRDYVYSRFVMSCLRAKRFRSPRTASYLGYAINMLIMGAWHGLSPRYLVYGAYHALLLCLNEYLDLHWKGFRRVKQSGPGRVVCVLVTFELFSLGLLIFSGRTLLL